MDWNGGAFIAQVEAKARRNVEAACIHVQNEARVKLSVAGTRVAGSAFTGTGVIGVKGKKYRKGRRIYGANPSKPGEAPHKQLGTLRASVAHEMLTDELAGLTGTSLEYGKYLELGAPRAHLLPRPWLRATLAEQKSRVVEIITKI